VQNVNDLFEKQLTVGERTADWVATQMGSWGFIIGQGILLLLWIVLNLTAFMQHWDPYPFILMNLVLSTQAAFAAPIIMMSQNRQAEKDRMEVQIDYNVNLKSAEEISVILVYLESQMETLQTLDQRLQRLEFVLGQGEMSAMERAGSQ
jgi:uncharacterized membrane protein